MRSAAHWDRRRWRGYWGCCLPCSPTYCWMIVTALGRSTSYSLNLTDAKGKRKQRARGNNARQPARERMTQVAVKLLLYVARSKPAQDVSRKRYGVMEPSSGCLSLQKDERTQSKSAIEQPRTSMWVVWGLAMRQCRPMHRRQHRRGRLAWRNPPTPPCNHAKQRRHSLMRSRSHLSTQSDVY